MPRHVSRRAPSFPSFVIAACLLLPAIARASAGVDEPPVEVEALSPIRPRLVGSVGGALGAFAGYEGTGFGFLARAGVEAPTIQGPVDHAVVAAVEGGRFAAWFDTPFLFRGVQLDTFSVRANWRVYPWARQGLNVEAGSGFMLARDSVDVELPTRDVRSTVLRSGVPFELGLGWVIAERLDLSLRYTHVLFTADDPAALGFLQLAVGGRL